MKSIHRDDLQFAAIGSFVFVVLAGLCAAGRWYLSWWYLANCGQSPECTAASIATDYWWLAFLGLALVVALPFHRCHQARLKARTAK